jgi:hypothetical protein
MASVLKAAENFPVCCSKERSLIYPSTLDSEKAAAGACQHLYGTRQVYGQAASINGGGIRSPDLGRVLRGESHSRRGSSVTIPLSRKRR